MKLYAYWRSSCSWRVRIALELKGLRYDVAPVNLIAEGGGQHGDAYRRLNPMEQVPALEVEEGGRTAIITQSMAICEYLDERHPEPPLLPRDRLDRAFVRQLAEMINAGIQPLQNLSVLSRAAEGGIRRRDWGAPWIEQGLAALEAVVSASGRGGPYLAGDAVTVADLFLIPQLYNGRRFGIDLSKFPVLVRAEAACETLPAFVAAHPDRQPDATADEAQSR